MLMLFSSIDSHSTVRHSNDFDLFNLSFRQFFKSSDFLSYELGPGPPIPTQFLPPKLTSNVNSKRGCAKRKCIHIHNACTQVVKFDVSWALHKTHGDGANLMLKNPLKIRIFSSISYQILGGIPSSSSLFFSPFFAPLLPIDAVEVVASSNSDLMVDGRLFVFKLVLEEDVLKMIKNVHKM